VLEKNPDYWNKGHPYLDRIILKPLPDAQSRFASLQSGEVDIIWDDEYDADNILKAQKDPKLTVHTYTGSGAQVWAFNTKHAPFDDVRVRQALVMALDRKSGLRRLPMVLADRRPIRTATAPGSSARLTVHCLTTSRRRKALIKDYGKPVDFKMIVTATPRGRTNGQVLQQFWKQIGANMEIEQIDQAAIPPRDGSYVAASLGGEALVFAYFEGGNWMAPQMVGKPELGSCPVSPIGWVDIPTPRRQ
jgi:peptide/nickel transport system substrate-binding protein